MKSLTESILSSNNAGILSKVKDNLNYCNDVTEFGKLWSALSLDIKDCHWSYASGGGYIYKGILNDNRIFCMTTTDPKKYPCMFIYDDSEKWPKKFDVKKYVKMVAKTLDMTYDYNEGGWYQLKFK